MKASAFETLLVKSHDVLLKLDLATLDNVKQKSLIERQGQEEEMADWELEFSKGDRYIY